MQEQQSRPTETPVAPTPAPAPAPAPAAPKSLDQLMREQQGAAPTPEPAPTPAPTPADIPTPDAQAVAATEPTPQAVTTPRVLEGGPAAPAYDAAREAEVKQASDAALSAGERGRQDFVPGDVQAAQRDVVGRAEERPPQRHHRSQRSGRQGAERRQAGPPDPPGDRSPGGDAEVDGAGRRHVAGETRSICESDGGGREAAPGARAGRRAWPPDQGRRQRRRRADSQSRGDHPARHASDGDGAPDHGQGGRGPRQEEGRARRPPPRKPTPTKRKWRVSGRSRTRAKSR